MKQAAGQGEGLGELGLLPPPPRHPGYFQNIFLAHWISLTTTALKHFLQYLLKKKKQTAQVINEYNLFLLKFIKNFQSI